MRRDALFLFGLLLCCGIAHAQINWGDYSQSYPEGATGKSPTIGLIVALRKGNDFLWSIREKSSHFYALDKDAAFRRLRPGEMVARTTFDTARAQFFLHGVNPQNAHLYQFRLTEYPGNRVLVPWHTISRFTDSALIKASGQPRMAYLGGYSTSLGKLLIMDVRKTESDRIVATSLVAWESITPVVTNVYTSETMDEFFKKLQYPWAPVKQPASHQSAVLKVPSTNANIILVLRGTIFYKEQVQYQLIRDGSVRTPWRYNDYDNSFIWINDCPPGSYCVNIRFPAQPRHVAEYRFEVEPAWYQTNRFRLIAGFFVAALLSACLFLGLFIRQRQKTRREQANRTKLQLELNAIYAQLNPHFVFNALSSIQGLINQQDIKGANRYLSDFARLMRGSLSNSHKNDIALADEIQTLGIYLDLEQLRFAFQYTIDVDDSINVSETSIPILLLQPLVENAVKHGVAPLRENGQINIVFGRLGPTMTVTITDNGRGFTEEKPTGGFGLKLTRDRLKLLNQINPGQPISVVVTRPESAGTQLTVTFTDWFL